jgi:hypothetical protein
MLSSPFLYRKLWNLEVTSDKNKSFSLWKKIDQKDLEATLNVLDNHHLMNVDRQYVRKYIDAYSWFGWKVGNLEITLITSEEKLQCFKLKKFFDHNWSCERFCIGSEDLLQYFDKNGNSIKVDFNRYLNKEIEWVSDFNLETREATLIRHRIDSTEKKKKEGCMVRVEYPGDLFDLQSEILIEYDYLCFSLVRYPDHRLGPWFRFKWDDLELNTMESVLKTFGMNDVKQLGKSGVEIQAWLDSLNDSFKRRNSENAKN